MSTSAGSLLPAWSLWVEDSPGPAKEHSVLVVTFEIIENRKKKKTIIILLRSRPSLPFGFRVYDGAEDGLEAEGWWGGS